MKILICLLATVYVCNATFLSLLRGNGGGNSGGSHVTYNVVATPTHGSDHHHGIVHASSYSSHDHAHNYYHDHGHDHDHSHNHGYSSSPPQVIKIILDQGSNGAQASSDGYSYAGGHSYGSSEFGQGGEAQIFKVISQSSAGPAPIHIDHGYSAGASHGWSSGSSYTSGYGHGSSSNYNSQLNAILPQILQLILEENEGHGFGGGVIVGDDLNSQLISHFGQKGKAIITRSNGKPNSFYSGGHVVQKGILKVTRVEGAPAHGPPAHIHSSHGPPVHGW